MKLKSIAVIGVGNLGSRHLQSISFIPSIENIFLVDPNKNSINKSIDRFKEIGGNKNIISCSFVKEISSKIDIAIISTNSKVRRIVIEEIINNDLSKNLILEKFLFPSIEDYEVISNLFIKNKINAWVNCPRRAYNFYQKIREEVKASKSLTIVISAPNLMVGTHGIHFLDLFSYLIRDNKIDEINTDYLDNRRLQSKRDGYVEFSGPLIFKSKKHFCLVKPSTSDEMSLTISIMSDDNYYTIFENDGYFLKVNYNNINTIVRNKIEKPFQSELTANLLQQFSKNGKMDLPRYDLSFKLHKKLLTSLMSFQKSVLKINENEVFIT